MYSNLTAWGLLAASYIKENLAIWQISSIIIAEEKDKAKTNKNICSFPSESFTSGVHLNKSRDKDNMILVGIKRKKVLKYNISLIQ